MDRGVFEVIAFEIITAHIKFLLNTILIFETFIHVYIYFFCIHSPLYPKLYYIPLIPPLQALSTSFLLFKNNPLNPISTAIQEWCGHPWSMVNAPGTTALKKWTCA